MLITLIFSCSVTKKAQRKLRKADKLIKEAGVMAPSLFDTVYVTKVDTVILQKDSITTSLKLVMDTIKVDSLVDELIEMRKKGMKTETITKFIYEEIIPDVTYNSKDSLKIIVDNETHYVRFAMDISIRNDNLVVSAKPLDNVPIVTEKTVVDIDATKKGRFWPGFATGAGIIILLVLAAWILRGVLTNAVG